jgi:eukaryotic-like serine/threonine-protein kinase
VAMKHVREPMPDVQRFRPEVSAALAAVVERATAKERANRYPSVEEMLRDLEQALAIEAARAGQATGEATAVLRALPDDTGGFAPGRLRDPRRVIRLTALLAVLAAAVVAFLVLRTERTDRSAPAASAPARFRLVELVAVRDFDPPPGDGREHPQEARNAIDGNVDTTWATERYAGGLQAQKDGVGIFVDAGRAVSARRLDIRSPTPGFDVQVHGARDVPTNLAGWGRPLGRATAGGESTRISFDAAGRPFRYYLVWLTKLPPTNKAEIAAVRLFR